MGLRSRACVVFVIACGGKPAVPILQPDLDNMKMYEPFEMRTDAKLPHQAIILGTDEKGGSTVVKLPTQPSSASVDAMGVGGPASIKMTTSPNPEGQVKVGIYEEKVGGLGSQWRASVWVSALVAANTLGKDLTDFTFSATAGGDIDGPSASGLIAAGFLATMTGEKIDPTATMTGVINPDGTIGPVNNIPEKLKTAIASGKKRIGYPTGMRNVKSSTGTVVDVVELAKQGGAVAVEIANVYDAYRLITGKALPEPLPVPASEMAIDADTVKLLNIKYQEWQARLATKSAALQQLLQAKSVPQTLMQMATYAQASADRAAKLHARAMIAPAFARLVGAWLYASAATASYEILTKVKAGDLEGARSALGAVDRLDPNRPLERIAMMKPTSIGGHLLMMGAFQSGLRGWGFGGIARQRLDVVGDHLTALEGKSKPELASQAVADELVALLAPAELLVARSIVDSTIALERIEFETAKSVGYMCSIPNVRRLATSFQSTSAAGINYFEAVHVEPLAQTAGITTDAARVRVALAEPDYLIAFAFAHLDTTADAVKQLWGEKSLAWNLLMLAANQRAYLDSAQLTVKYYSLAAQSNGGSTSVDHENAFKSMLASADRAARTSARAARIATGAIPVQAKLAYQQALAQRDGDIADRLDALASYWASAAYSHAVIMLARN